MVVMLTEKIKIMKAIDDVPVLSAACLSPSVKDTPASLSPSPAPRKRIGRFS